METKGSYVVGGIESKYKGFIHGEHEGMRTEWNVVLYDVRTLQNGER